MPVLGGLWVGGGGTGGLQIRAPQAGETALFMVVARNSIYADRRARLDRRVH